MYFNWFLLLFYQRCKWQRIKPDSCTSHSNPVCWFFAGSEAQQYWCQPECGTQGKFTLTALQYHTVCSIVWCLWLFGVTIWHCISLFMFRLFICTAKLNSVFKIPELNSTFKFLELNSTFRVPELCWVTTGWHCANCFTYSLCFAQILDFGLARSMAEEMTGYVVCRWYRAPEIILNWMHYNSNGEQNVCSIG